MSRTGTYLNFCLGNHGSSIHLWLRAVPALAWADDDTYDSWVNAYLEDIRLVVVDQSGVRRPYPGDPLEEAICRTLAELIGPRATPVEEALGLLVDLEHDVGWDVKTPEIAVAEATWTQVREEFERSL